MLVGASVAIGWIAWSGYALTLPVAMVFPALWAASRNRLVAATVAAGYFLSSSRGLPQGVATYFGTTVWAGILLWLAASISFVGVHALLWTRRSDWRRAFHYLVTALLMAVPPLGIVGWAHPITAAGVLFPEWGWWGLVATVLLLTMMATRFWPIAAVTVFTAWVCCTASWGEPAPPPGWTGGETELSATLGGDHALDQFQLLSGMVRERGRAGARVIVLPESAFGIWTPTVERFWIGALAGTGLTVVGGAVLLDRRGYDSVMIKVDGHKASVLYSARMTVPVSMWQPWSRWLGDPGGARATFFADPVIEVGGLRAAPLICYEQLLVWPILQSAWHRPDTIVSIANGWWASGTSIPAIQQAETVAWSRLFGLTLVSAVNR